MYLLDTSVVLEFLLDQEEADDVQALLENVPGEMLRITEFTLYSTGILLLRRKLADRLLEFVEDFLDTGAVRVIRLSHGEMANIVQAASRCRLDFDDAYQCVAAEKHDLTLVSFDTDFDRTERGRKTPADVLKKLQEPPENRGNM